jgi:pilus assembly protein FimV
VAELSRNVEELAKLSQAARPDAAGSAAVPASAPAAPPVLASPPASAAVLAPAVPIATPAAPPRPAPAPSVPAAEPDLVTSLLDHPMVLPGAGALVALLAGLGIYRMRRRQPAPVSKETSFLESKSPTDSFFGATGGQRVDTREANATGAASSMSYSLSQLDAIGDVDPVAEADVYLAYGRDLQAEEILKEAMRASPDRLAIRTKLLEVYAKRRDTKGFEQLAVQLHALTHGEGEDWTKAQELGRQIDPDNPLYQAGGQPVAAGTGSARAAEALGASTLPLSVLPTPSAYGALDSRQPIEPLPALGADLDLDLTAPIPEHEPSAPVPLMETTQPMQSTVGLGGDSTLDFELPIDDTSVSALPADTPRPPAPVMDFDLSGLSLDLDMPAAPAVSEGASTGADFEPPMLDFRSIAGAAPIDATDQPVGADDAADPLQRKLELADEFRQIGDVEGARDLLEEVVAKGGDSLKARAQAMLDRLA